MRFLSFLLSSAAILAIVNISGVNAEERYHHSCTETDVDCHGSDSTGCDLCFDGCEDKIIHIPKVLANVNSKAFNEQQKL